MHGSPTRHILLPSINYLTNKTRESKTAILRASSSAGGNASGNDRAVFDGEEEWEEVAEVRAPVYVYDFELNLKKCIFTPFL